MTEGRSGQAKLNPDGTTGLTIDGRRYTLGVPTLGDLEDLRSLYRDVAAEQEDYIDLVHRPGLQDLGARVKGSTDPEERQALRKELRVLEDDRNWKSQDGWATWWRSCFDRLCRDPLPAYEQRPAEGLPPWMVESAAPISTLFAHWRADPFRASGASDLATALQRLSDPGG